MPCLCKSGLRICAVNIRADSMIDVYNKIDAISLEQMNKLAHEDHTLVISCEMDLKYPTFFAYQIVVLNQLFFLA